MTAQHLGSLRYSKAQGTLIILRSSTIGGPCCSLLQNVSRAPRESGFVFARALNATREAIHNVVRHADAKELRLSFHVTDGQLLLRLEDDGRGFTPGATKKAAPGGLGLDSMRERIGNLGGRVKIDTTPGQGTRVEFCVPLDPSARAGQ